MQSTSFASIVVETLHDIGLFLHAIFWPHIIAFGAFALALLVVARLFSERRTPSNTLAWSFVILSAPYIGVPLYFLFGGRKSRRLVENKKAVKILADQLVCVQNKGLTPPIWKHNLDAHSGHTFRLLPNGQVAFQTFLEQIQAARNSIHIATYIFGQDAVGQQLLNSLIQKAQAGLKVRLLVDALGSFWVKKKFFAPLIEAGGQVAYFMPVLPLQTKTSANLRNHRKIAIFDDQLAIIGGQNLEKRFLGTSEQPALFEDFGALIEGPVVAQLTHIFVSDWCFAAKQAPDLFLDELAYKPSQVGDQAIRIISSGPDMEGDPLWESLMTLIQDCQECLTIVTPYFLPDEVLFRSLMVKARTGRHVQLILPAKSNHALVDLARQHFLRPLHEAGVKIFLYTGPMLHAKAFMVDSRIAMIGSANFDLRSLFVNFEIGVFLSSQPSIKALQEWIDGLSPRLLPYRNDAPPGVVRRWAEDLAHILVPLL